LVIVNTLLNRVFDLLMLPLRRLDDRLALAIVSLATAVALLVVFRATSNQRALVAVKRQFHADLFEIRLFNDDLTAMFRAQGEVLRHNALYLRLSLVPMLWTVVPLIFLLAQLDAYFGYTGAEIGQTVLVTAQLANQPGDLPAELVAPPDVRITAGPVRFPALRQVVWQVVPDRPDDYLLRLRIGPDTYSKTLHVSNALARRSPARSEASLLDELAHPSEPGLPKGAPATSVRVQYADRRIRILEWELPWWAAYFVATVLLGMVLRTPLGVTL
jgi:hypothetical protein